MDPDFEPYSRAQRLLNLTMALRATRFGLDRADIRATVRGYDRTGSQAAFERMFERDKDDLRAMGLPLRTRTDATGNVTGYRIEGDWSLPPLDLDPGELALLALAARAWRSTELGPAAVNALRKVETRLGAGARAPDDAEPASFAESPVLTGLTVDAPRLGELIPAVRMKQAIRFSYHRGGQHAPVERHVTPWALVWWQGHWYLVGHDSDRGAVRVFRASRIVGALRADASGTSVPMPEGFDARAAVGTFAGSSQVMMQAALSPGVGAGLRRRGRVVGHDVAGHDGAQEFVEFGAEDLATGVASVLALGAGARVHAPQEATAEARRQLAAIVAAGRTEPAPSGAALRGSQLGSPAMTQFSRLLALIPWLAGNSGVSVSEAAAHFGVTQEQLLADLGSVITSGPDDWTLFDVQYWEDGGVIEVIDALAMTSALAFTPEEAFALVIALDALAAGAAEPKVESLRAKLRSTLGPMAPAPDEVGVRIDVPEKVQQAVAEALRLGRTLELTYLGEVRDEVTHRVVDPIGLVVWDGRVYLRAHCRLAHGLRTFRVDRILSLTLGDEPARDVSADDLAARAGGADGGAAPLEPIATSLARSGRTVTVDVSPEGQHIIDQVPTAQTWSLPDGWVRVRIPVGSYAWAKGLALGSRGTVVLREPAELVRDVFETARAMHSEMTGS